MSYSWTMTPFIGDLDAADHAADAVVDSLDQYSEKPRFHAMLAAFMAQIQSLEDVSQDELTMRSVYTAEGVQLDVLGDIVDLERGELSDDAYRIFILGKIYANRADGQIDQIYELLTGILGKDTVHVHEYWPCAMEIWSSDITYPDVVNRLMALMVASGVLYSFDFSSVAESLTFTFSSVVNTEETSASQGIGSMNSETTDGGQISGTLRRP